MSTSKRGQSQTPIQVPDLLDSIADNIAVAPIAPQSRNTASSTTSNYQFDPSNPYYEYIKNPTPFTTGVDELSAKAQSNWSKVGRGLLVGGANLASSFGQSLLSTFDLVGAANTAKGFITGSDDDFDSSFMGVHTKDLMNWSTNVAKNNQIFEKDKGSFSPGDVGWWANEMLPQLGTLVGTGLAALGTTALIEASTGGTGTAVAAANLAKNIKNLWGAKNAAEVVMGGLDLAKGMKGAATVYASLARYSEARFEAQNNFKNTYEKLSNSKHPDGTPFTEEEKQHLASAGARVDFGLTLAQLPLDILAFRAMVFNPIAGVAEGELEKGLEHLAGAFGESKLGKAAGWATTKGLGSGIEAIEAGGIPIFQNEGEHHAMVLGGLEKDDTNVLERVSKDIQSPEFANMVASGFLGSLLIGPAMKATQDFVNKNKIAAFNERYDDYLKNVVTMHDSTINGLKELDKQGKTDDAFAVRRNFFTSKLLDGLQLDSQANKGDIANSHLNFLKSTLDQVNSGNYDNIKDLYGDVKPEQVEQVKREFQTYIDDANRIKDSYTKVASRHTRNFVPLITRQHYNLNTWLDEQGKNELNINQIRPTLDQYTLLSPVGKEKYDTEYELYAHQVQIERLKEQYAQTEDAYEKENINKLIDENQTKATKIKNRLDEIEADDTIDPEVRAKDNDIIRGNIDSKNYLYQKAIIKKAVLNDAISLQRKRLAQWNNPEFIQTQKEKAIKNARTNEQIQSVLDNTTKKIAKDKQDALKAKDIADGIKNEAQQQNQAVQETNEIVNPEQQQTEEIEQPKNNPEVLKGFNTVQQLVAKVVLPMTKSTSTVPQNSELKRIDLPNEQHRVDTAATQQLLDYAAEVYKVPKIDASTNPNYISWLQNLGNVGYEVANKLNAPRLAFDLLKGAENQNKQNYETIETRGLVNLQSPIEVNPSTLSDDEKSQLKNAVSDMANELGHGTNFEDLVKGLISNYGDKYVRTAYDTLKLGWQLNNKTADFDDIKKRLLDATPKAIFDQILNKVLLDGKQKDDEIVTVNNNQSEKDTIEKSGNPVEFDNDNQPVLSGKIQYKSKVTNNPNPKIAKSVRSADMLTTLNDDGTVTISYDYTSDELKEGDNINPFKILDYDNYGVGTQLDIRIPENVDSIIIPIYNADGSKGKAVTWGEWKVGKDPKSDEYISKIPIIVYDKGAKEGEKGLGFVHDIGWYHEYRFNEGNPEEMKMAIDNTMAIRKAALANNGKEVIQITENRPTTFDPFKTKVIGKLPDGKPMYEFIPFSEANPEVVFAIAEDTSELTINNKDAFTKDRLGNPNENIILRDIKENPYKIGLSYALYRTGTHSDGRKIWTAMEVSPQPITKEIQTTIFQALKIFINRFHPDFEKLYKKTKDDIQEATKLDITDATDIQRFISLYINDIRLIKATNKQAALNQIKTKSDNRVRKGGVDANGNNRVQPITGFVTFLQGGSGVLFGQHNTTFNYDLSSSIGEPKPGVTRNDTSTRDKLKTVTSILNNILKSQITTPNGKVSILGSHKMNYDIRGSQEDRPIVYIDEQGKVSNAADSYRDYILKNYTTNIRSVNIGTKEKPKYVSSDNMVSYKLSSQKEEQEAQVLTKPEEIKEKVDEVKKELDEIKPQPETDVEVLLRERMNKLKELGLDFNIESIDDLQSPRELNTGERVQVTSELNRIGDLNEIEESEIVSYFTNQMFQAFEDDGGVILKSKVEENTKRIFKEAIEPAIEVYKGEVIFWNNWLNEHPEQKTAGNIPNLVATIIKKIDRINRVKNNIQPLIDKAIAEIEKVNGVDLVRQKEESSDDNDRDINDSTDDEHDNQWADESLTRNPENGVSSAVRIFLKAIPTGKKGVFGLDTYEDSSKIIQVLQPTLADIPCRFDDLLEGIKNKLNEQSWKDRLVTKLSGANQQIKYQFTSLMSMSPLRMKFTMIEYTPAYGNKPAIFKASLWDTGKGGVADAIMKDWVSRFTISDLVFKETDAENNLVLNKKKAQILVDDFSTKFRDSKNYNKIIATNHQMQEWLSKFGIIVSDKTMDDLRAGKFYHNYKKHSWEKLFNETSGLFGILSSKLKSLIDEPEDHSFKKSSDIPINQTIIKTLASLQTKYDTTHIPYGGRDNGKSYFAITARKFVTTRALELKSDISPLRGQLKKISFSRNSMWLNLMDDEDFRSKFDVSHIGFTALDILGNKFKSDKGIDKLGDLDYETASNNMFFDMTKGEVVFKDDKGVVHRDYPGTSIDMRWATMLGPTMSDKHIAIPLTVPVLNFKNKDLGNGQKLSDEVIKLVYTQVVKPELERMSMFHSIVKATNIKGYDEGASLFLMMPSLNTLDYGNGVYLKDAIKNEPDTITIEEIEKNEDLMSRINQAIRDNINSLKEEKLTNWKNNKIVDTNADGTISSINFISTDYIDEPKKFSGSLDEKANMAALDLVTNQMISLANSFMLFAGDPALKFKSDEKEDYIQMAKDTFINIGKRLANQIAPGTSPAESENEKYIQLFIKDRSSIADKAFMKFSTRINDGKEMSDGEYEQLQKGENIDRLKEKYPNSSGFFDIEASDAQEYTTWTEHLNLMEKLGKMPEIIIDITAAEIQEARDLFSSKTTKEQLTDRQQKLIGKIMQPMKPVYTGQQFDEAQDVMRDIYIKSSAFPLIPQLTAGMEIDKLRLKMEALESSDKYKGMGVRASYQSANKVGALKNARTIWDRDGRFIEGSMDNLVIPDSTTTKEENLGASGLILDRKNFRIQQEVPFKSSKQGFDFVSYGTQLMKLLFGNDVMSFDGFNYQGEKRTGEWLHKEYNDLHIKLIQSKKEQLYNELGLDKHGVPVDKDRAIKKLQKLLLKEANNRGLPVQTTKGLDFRKDPDGNIINEFVLPIWSSINSNKFEALMNSIVTNRIAKLKFHGNSFVAGSPEGFKLQADLKGVDQSKIIYTSAWNGSELQAIYDENSSKIVFAGAVPDPKGEKEDEWWVNLKDGTSKQFNTEAELKEYVSKNKLSKVGKISKSQVFVTSKFKDNNGKLINLFEKNEDGSGKYITQSEDKSYHIRPEMFDKELLQLIGFRIPTTGLGSGSSIEIAGFLPAQQGDLMILPSIYTKIKGLDFDVDKENTYAYYHYQNEDGKIEKLSSNHKSRILSKHDADFKNNRLRLESADKLIDSVLKSEEIEDYTDNEIEQQDSLIDAQAKLEDQLTQNKIIEIYQSVYSNPNKKLQAKINSVLNTKFTEDQADIIEKATPKNDTYWTALSGEYQKQKLIGGATGGLGKGAYSMDVTFHAQAQQAKAQGKPLKLIWVDSEGKAHNKIWKFGDIESHFELGSSRTMDVNGKEGDRDISNVLDEVAQTGVDHEKLQIMNRVNLNKYTLDVQKIFNLTGLFKGTDGGSLAMRFMSQPIIREYVNKLSNATSNVGRLSNFENGKAAKERIKNELITKYFVGALEEDYNHNRVSPRMTSVNMLKAIKDSGADGELQAAVLLRFLDMEKYGLAIRAIQTGLNVESKGLDKSYFNVIAKRDALNEMGKGNAKIENVDSLIGDYEDKPQSESGRQKLREDGYYEVGDQMIKPTTLVGAFNVVAVNTAYNLWNKYLPYDSVSMNAIFDEILPLIEQDDSDNITRQIELKQDIFAELKKYLATFEMAGMFGNNETANSLRKELYIDTDENTSLAYYMQQLYDIKGSKNEETKELTEEEKQEKIKIGNVIKYIRTNPLLNKLEYVPSKIGEPSLIKYNNAIGESYDESYLYNSLVSMLEVKKKDKEGNSIDIKLPKIGNKEYTLNTLAQALISYSFLGNAKQEAIQFTKYTSVGYLTEIGYAYTMRVMNDRLPTMKGLDMLGIKANKEDGEKHLVSPFTTQYIQHTPESMVSNKNKFKLDDFNKRFKKQKDGTYIDILAGINPFVSVYDRSVSTKKKIRLYKFDGEKYSEIPILGTFGMDEYSKGSDVGLSILNKTKPRNISPTKALKQNIPLPESLKADIFDVQSGKAINSLQKIVDNQLGSYSALAKELLPYVSKDIDISYNNVTWAGESAFYGSYNIGHNDIRINPDTIGVLKNEQLASVILEEVVHMLTASRIQQYITQNTDGSVDVRNNSPSYVSDIVRLYNDVRSKSDPNILKSIADKKAKDQGLTPEELLHYSVSNIYEFLARSISNKAFQEYLNKDQFKQSGKTRLQVFKEFIFNILRDLGLDLKADSAAVQAIDSIFEFIDKETKKESDIDEFNNYYDEGSNYDLPPFDPDDTGGDVLGTLSPTEEFPNKELDIRNEKCK